MTKLYYNDLIGRFIDHINDTEDWPVVCGYEFTPHEVLLLNPKLFDNLAKDWILSNFSMTIDEEMYTVIEEDEYE